MSTPIDLTGQRFGRLFVASSAGKSHDNRPQWRCLCDCGAERLTVQKDLLSGHTKSCGCTRIEKLRQTQLKHGMYNSSEYGIWKEMRRRCYNPRSVGYPSYGGRGIVVCGRWKNDFSAFYEDLGPRPSLKHSIDRIDNDGNYEPSNVRWATKEMQDNNRQETILVSFDGETRSLKQWSKQLGISYTTLRYRYHEGWPAEKMFAAPGQRSIAETGDIPVP